jgi:hypothetical protein
MSPSESDLRAALRQGEEAGFQVNADAIMQEGQAVRARRVRIMSGAAAAVLVAAGAVGLAVARGDGGGTSPVAGAANASARAAKSARHGAPRTAPAAAPNASQVGSNAGPVPDSLPALGAATPCPASAPHLLAPGGGSPGQFGADQPLFAEPVETLVVCSYQTTTSTGPGRLTFTGSKATQIVTSIENAAPKATAPTPCDPGPTSTSRLLAFIGVTPAGAALPPVTATVTFPACTVQVTNGTAVRFDWSPPAVLTGELNGLTPPRSPITVPDEPTGINQGSPLHS